MAKENGIEKVRDISLFISKSTTTSRVNKTGAWRFARPRYLDKTAPCSAACPAGVDIPKIELEITKGEIRQAWDTYMLENPFPAVCGRVCFHSCESACNRSRQDKPVSINRLDRFVGDAALDGERRLESDNLSFNGRKVAIVGSGPAGLSAAYFLTKLGFVCEIFEAKSHPGGVLHWGIPAYRLPKEILQKEIRRIVRMGVEIHCNQPADEKFCDRLKTSHDALFLGCGLGRPVTLRIPGNCHMEDGLALLETIQNGKPPAVKGQIAVIGGGNTAVDVTRSLIRLGAQPVILYRRRRKDMPAFEHEIEAAEAEGARIVELVSPVAIEAFGDGVTVRLAAMRTAETAEDGRARVVPDDDHQTEMTFASIYSGIGADVEKEWYRPENVDSASVIRLSHCSLQIEETPTVYGGDPVVPVKSVTDAIASGKQAAIALHSFFDSGSGSILPAMEQSLLGPGPALSMELYLSGERKFRDPHVVAADEINLDYFTKKDRVAVPQLPRDRACETFEEIESTLSVEDATREAERCYQCGFCNDCDNCRIFCAEVSIEIVDGKRRINLDYCKGCGVCVTECPRCAMIIEEEQA